MRERGYLIFSSVMIRPSRRDDIYLSRFNILSNDGTYHIPSIGKLACNSELLVMRVRA